MDITLLTVLEDADVLESDEEDVLEGDNETSSIEKDTEIEKLKRDVVDLRNMLFNGMTFNWRIMV